MKLIARRNLQTDAGRGVGSGDTFEVEADEASALVESGAAEAITEEAAPKAASKAKAGADK